MPKKIPPEPRTPFDKMKGSDGFHVIEVDAAGQAALQLVLRQEGETEFEVLDNSDGEVWCRKNPTARDAAERHRAEIVMEAICRYFNTGGSWDELNQMLEVAEGFIPGGIVFPGWHYYDGHFDREGKPVDIFVKEGTGEMVRWFQSGYFEPTSEDDLISELEEDYDEGEEEHCGGLRGPLGAEDPSEESCDVQAPYPALPGPGTEG